MKRDDELRTLTAEARRRDGVQEVVFARQDRRQLRYVAVANGTPAESRAYDHAQVDRVGAGDAAAAAYLVARTCGKDVRHAVELAAAAAAWHEATPGYAPSFSPEVLSAVVDGETRDIIR